MFQRLPAYTVTRQRPRRDQMTRVRRLTSGVVMLACGVAAWLHLAHTAAASRGETMRSPRWEALRSSRSAHLRAPSWKSPPSPLSESLPSAPAGFQEGSGVRVGKDVWFMGGYPLTSGHVWVFDLEARAWRAGQSLPFVLHHSIMSAFEHDGSLIVVGGMIYDAALGAHHPNDAFLRPGATS